MNIPASHSVPPLLLAAGLLVLSPATGLSAQASSDVTFAKDIAPIFQDNCVGCHRAGGGAPMSLETYDSARRYARRIREKTQIRDRAGAMPPWFVERDIGIQEFANDMGLTEAEIATIGAWVDAGAPEGDPGDMPPPREFRSEGQWTIRPDLILTTEEILVEGGRPDWWGDITPIPIPLEEDRYVAAVEVREINDVPPEGGARETVGGRYVIHHLNYQTMVPGDFATRQQWPVHEVGRNADVLDPETGWLLRADAELTSESLHLHSNGRDTRARLEIAFQFHPEGYEPKYERAGLFPVPGNTVDIDIRPDQDGQELHSYAVLADHTKIISFEPHLHAPGTRMCLEAIWGSRSETLSCVGYDHSWVRTYFFAKDHQPLLPKGTILHITGWMNTERSNPNVSDSRNWSGGGNRSVSNMFLELGLKVRLTDEQFLDEMAQRRENLGLTKDDYVIGCPLCLATIPATGPKPTDGADDGTTGQAPSD